MTHDIIKRILEADGEAALPPRKNPLIDKLADAGTAPEDRQPTTIIQKLVSASPLDLTEKQKGPVTVIMVTPYGTRQMKGLVKTLAKIDKDVGKVGTVLFEGSFEIGRKLPKLAKKYDFRICVRDHWKHLDAFSHLGGSGRTMNPMEEVRQRLDDSDRLLRHDEQAAFEDMLDIATGTKVMVIMPGSSRMAMAEQLAAEHGLTPVLAPQDPDTTYADDLESAPMPATLLVVTPEEYHDIGALLMVRTHISYLGRKVAKIVHTPSMAMEVLSGLNDGTTYEELDLNAALSNPLGVIPKAKPDYIVVAGDSNLGAAVANIASHVKPQVPCAELPGPPTAATPTSS